MSNNRIFVVRELRQNKVLPMQKEKELSENDSIKDDLVEFIEKKQEIDCDSPYYNSQFFKSIKPAVFFLKCFGLFFKRYKVNDKWHTDVWFSMCLILCLFQIFNFARSCSVFSMDEQFNDLLFFKIQTAIWTLENTVKMLGLLYACFGKEKLPLFFQLWTTTCEDKPLSGYLKIILKTALFMSSCFVVVNTGSLIMSYMVIPELEDLFLHVAWPDVVGAPDTLIFKIIFVICTFVNSGIAMFSITFMVILCFAISKEFHGITNKIKSNVEKDGSFSCDLEAIRLRHQGLCRMSNILDESFMVVIAIVYISNVPMSCIILYNAIYVKHTLTLTIFNIFWMVFLMLHMVIVSVVCALINVAAHKPLEELYRISATQLQNQQIQLIMFMNRLTGSEVGLTAIKMFVINRPTILTVIGMLITYFVLLVQFKTPATAICHCNSTGT